MFPSQNQQGEQQDQLGQVLDKAITNLFNVQAQNRFTRAPININPGYLSGSYRPGTGRIAINTPYADPFWHDYQRVQAHEGIHSLLSDAGYLKYLVTGLDDPEKQKLNEKVLGLFSKRNFGIPAAETPAYIATQDYRPLPGIEFNDAFEWFKNFRETLTPESRKLLERVVANYEQSKTSREPDKSTRIK